MRSYVAKLQAFYDEATTQVAAMEAALKDAKASIAAPPCKVEYG
jgi:hypothetical protein